MLKLANVLEVNKKLQYLNLSWNTLFHKPIAIEPKKKKGGKGKDKSRKE